MPAEVLAEVNVDIAWPAVIVPVGGAMVPLVAEKLTPTCGTNVGPETKTLSEFLVRSAVTVEFAPGVVGFGAAVVPSTIQGLLSSTPVFPAKTSVPLVVPLHPAPVAPGPKLQPHQLFSTLMVALLPVAILAPY